MQRFDDRSSMYKLWAGPDRMHPEAKARQTVRQTFITNKIKWYHRAELLTTSHTSHRLRQNTTVFPAPRHYAANSALPDTTNQSNQEPSNLSPDSSPRDDLGEPRGSRSSLDTPDTRASAGSSEQSISADAERIGVEMVEVALGYPRRTGQIPYYVGM